LLVLALGSDEEVLKPRSFPLPVVFSLSLCPAKLVKLRSLALTALSSGSGRGIGGSSSGSDSRSGGGRSDLPFPLRL
jgi:hypothetical protein